MHKILPLFLVMFFFLSCSTDSEVVNIKKINGSWDKKTEQQFDFSISDTKTPKNVIFVIRNNNNYPYSNIRFIVNFTNLKNKKKETDTLNYVIAKPTGEWIGSGFGDTKEILVQYKTKYTFPTSGSYRIGIIQAMRNGNLPGIEDLGVKIESAKP